MCPGCGDYAPDIAPPAHRSHRAVAAPAAWESWPGADVPAPGPHQGTGYADAAPLDSAAYEDVTAEVSGADPVEGLDVADGTSTAATGQGRAARRRQLARWKKHRRRAVAATAFALVGGGLTVSMLQNKPSQAHAASTPEPESVGTPRTEPAASVSKEPDTGDTRDSDSRPSRSASRQRETTAAAPSTAPTVRHPKSAAATHPLAAPNGTPHTTPSPDRPKHARHAATPAPTASASAPAGPSDANTPSASPAPNTPSTPAADPKSPTHLCLLGVVCIGS
ncbi:hypothetical protein [Streptomyces sp. NPDC053427]|uniref:SCO2400 family protein n=1 Tax=Streptomyces sp. NPDC053427 TaxID=3365701 RepID=UPI0037D1580C